MMNRLIRQFRRYFVPHEHNDHRPHLLRWEVSFAVVGAVLAAEATFLLFIFFIMPGIDFLAAILPAVIVDETNFSRRGHSLSPLSVNPSLAKAAARKAEDMAQKGYFAHFGPDGKSPWAWMHEAGYVFDYAGENLAVDFVDSADVAGAWMNSPSHRDNVLNGEFTEIGIGIAEGIYQGRNTIFVVEMFGKPAEAGREVLSSAKLFPPVEERVISSTKSKQKGEVMTEQTASSSEEILPSASSSFIAFSEETAQTGGGERAPGFYALFLGRIFSNPGRIANLFYLALMTAVALALLLNVFVKMRVQHPRLIVNGVMMLLVLSAVVLLNQYIALAAARIL